MAVHRLFPGTTAPTASAAQTTPISTTAVRRSARLGSPTRKRARVSDSSSEPSSSQEPTPRSIRAHKRQKIFNASPPPVDNGKTRAGKRKTLVPDDEHRVVKKRIVNDALAPTETTRNVNLDTRKRGGNNVCCSFLVLIAYLMIIPL